MSESEVVPSVNKPFFRNSLWQLTFVCSIGLITASVLTLIAEHWWLADLCANLRMQGVIGLLLTSVLLACFRNWKLVGLQLCLIGLHCSWLAAGWPQNGHSTAAPVLTVVTANVYGRNRRHNDIEKEILANAPDVVAIVELSYTLQESLSTDFHTTYSYSVKQPQDHGNFGIGLYSKFPLESPRIVYFNDDAIPSAMATVAVNGRRIHVLAIHTLPPVGGAAFRHRNQQLELVGNYVKEHRKNDPDVPVVVMGDLNLTPWSPLFRNFQQESTLQAARVAWTPTWYRFSIFPFGLVLDHVFSTDDLRCIGYDVGRDVGSDHRFVTVKLADLRSH